MVRADLEHRYENASLMSPHKQQRRGIWVARLAGLGGVWKREKTAKRVYRLGL